MFPELFSLGPFTLHTYGLFVALGVFAALFLMTHQAKRDGFPEPAKVFDLVFVIVFFGFIGGRLFYVVQEGEWYRDHPMEIFQIWKGGLVYYGGMIASFVGFLIYLKAVRLPLLATTDFVMPSIALAHAFGRIGCFLNGCCYGKPCPFPWGVEFPFLSEPVHPTQLYEAGFNAFLFLFLIWFYPRRRFAGEVTSIYLLFYPLGRFVLEFFRGDQPAWLLSLTLHQVFSLAFFFGGLLLYGICRRRR